MTTISYSDELVVVTCWCGTTHAVPSALREFQLRKHRDGQDFSVYCPLGHTYSPAGEGAAAKERKRREAAELALRAERDQHAAERKAHAATKAKLTRTKNRADKGVCLYCHRSYENVARHVRTKHPEAVECSPTKT